MRLIDADALKRERFTHLIRFWDGKVLYSKMIDDAPTIDVEPVRHGRWFEMVDSKLDTHTGEYWEEVYYNCLECDYASDWKSPYCPNCGAKMYLEG